MIIFGNKESIEVIYYPKEIGKVKEVCNIDKSLKPFWKTNITTSYKCNNKKYYLHNANSYILLSQMLVNYMAEDKMIHAPKSLQWVINSARSRFQYIKLENWIDSIRTYSYTHKEIYKYYPVDVIQKLKYFSNGISSWLIQDKRIIKSPYKSRKFDIYKKNDLYNIVSNVMDPYYLEILLSKNDKYETVLHNEFKKLSEHGKKQAVLEKVYVETINEYIIPELEIYNRFPDNLKECFLRSYMNVLSQYMNYDFLKFMLDEYNSIINGYNEKTFTVIFKNALKELKRI